MKFKGYAIDKKTTNYQKKQYEYHNEYSMITASYDRFYVTGKGFRYREFATLEEAKETINIYVRKQDKKPFKNVRIISSL